MSLLPQRVNRFVTTQKRVAITFDDGPDPRFTQPLLELLAQHNALATFFVRGSNVAAHPALAGRMQAAGHELGIHGWHHASLRWSTRCQVQQEIRRTRDALATCGVTKVDLFRPPYMRMGWGAVLEVAAQNLVLVGQSWKTHDYHAPSVEWLVKRVVSKTRPGDILIFHDGGGDRSLTLKALEQILPQLVEQGICFCTIHQMMAKKPTR
ncbi:MAG: polysaccharide deacetylase family protein [Candidatus Cloacimonetes bacterium]|nr:polysaccharide deacetylase family protein [Candidatus Cloacimonadota bacterium]